MDNLIVIKQLPIIEEQLQTIKAEVTEKIEKALSLVCTEDTLAEVKDIRAKLNKEFAEWEEKRKDVKKAITDPYTQFEASYKDCITDVYKNGDLQLKGKIDAVESVVKSEKAKEVEEYFNEYRDSKHIDFVSFKDAGITVNLSVSKKKLKEQAKAFLDKICDDLTLIDTQDHKEEILYEYKKSLNVSAAITMVTARFKAIEEAKAREAERHAQIEAEKEAAKVVEDAARETEDVSLCAPSVEETATCDEEPELALTFTVRGTLTKLKAFKECVIEYAEREGLSVE
ncbi:MAG: DUF1351 domain-containing protein [Clostridia bacterium]|nr:DUF1351 domain-containing protein [Clostridia bacterium]